MHYPEEERNDHITILDTVVNRFKIQIILTDKTKDSEMIHRKKKINSSSIDITGDVGHIYYKILRGRGRYIYRTR